MKPRTLKFTAQSLYYLNLCKKKDKNLSIHLIKTCSMNLGACEGCYRDKSFCEFLDMQCNWKIDQKSSFFLIFSEAEKLNKTRDLNGMVEDVLNGLIWLFYTLPLTQHQPIFLGWGRNRFVIAQILTLMLYFFLALGDKCMDCDVHAICYNGRCKCRPGYKGSGFHGDCKPGKVIPNYYF